MKNLMKLSRSEMKGVMGGLVNPNCNGVTGTSTWYCCAAAGGVGATYNNVTCDSASTSCGAGMITNDSSRCGTATPPKAV